MWLFFCHIVEESILQASRGDSKSEGTDQPEGSQDSSAGRRS